ncbi:MAG: restriction endonuclease [Alphaproteobacteria bacterium]|nr:restriction endonuclease [Alphaproteobacteria bacterium]
MMVWGEEMLSDYERLMRPRDDRDVRAANLRERSTARGTERALTDILATLRRAHEDLVQDLISHIHAQSPGFFEELVIDVLLAVGYGARRRDLARRLGGTGDGGVDGLIAQDELGLELIYLQAKRLKPGSVVPVSEVRDFVGSLDAHRAGKGIFVTTSHFSSSAIEFCDQVSRRVVLIDGTRFAELMIRHNIGVTVVESYQVKKLNDSYFLGSSARATSEMISASSQPRR